MKNYTLIVLLIPLSIIILYNYSPQFIYVSFLVKPYPLMLLHEISTKIQYKIHYNKFLIQNQQILQQCKWVLTDEKKQHRQLFPITQTFESQYMKNMCKNFSIPEMLVITIIFQNEQKLKFLLKEYREIIEKETPIGLHFEIIAKQESEFPQQFQGKLGLHDYTEIMAQYFLNTNHMSHCRYTNQRCHNYLIYLFEDQVLEQQSYYQYRNIYITTVSNVIQTINVILLLQPFTHFQSLSFLLSWKKYIFIQKLNQLQQLITYHENTEAEQFYSYDNLQRLQSLNKALQKMSFSAKTKQWRDVLSSKISIFPTQYKLGVYLPIIFVFFLLPFFNYITK